MPTIGPEVGLEESVVPFESQAVSQFREARFRVAGFPQLMNADRKKSLSPVLTRPPFAKSANSRRSY